MCGIAGYWDFGFRIDGEQLHGAILGMTQSLAHRGPDSGGLWIEKSTGMALGHRRLAIRDISALGHQPMLSPDGRFVLSYNGEIYNTGELMERLARRGAHPLGNSDTEILLLSLMTFGMDATLEKILGMFAFALWDRREKKLCLARDRFGVKPLYWTMDGGKRFLFASEPDAFFQAGDWNPKIDMKAVAQLLRYGNIPAPLSIWQGVNKLEPAHRLDVDATGGIAIKSYWDSLAAAKAGLDNPLRVYPQNVDEFVDELDNLLTDAVSRRMVSDVPLGAFLSGGVDSSTVAALMQKCRQNPIKTFSIGFEEDAYNEAPFAKAIAAHIGTDHTEMYVPAKAAWEIIPELPHIYDEPFADSSQIPTLLLSRLARRHVATVLSGDGGDEIFGGYQRYAACLKNFPESGSAGIPAKFAAAFIRALPASRWDKLAALLPKGLRPRNAGTRLHNFADIRLERSLPAFYRRYYLQFFWHPDTILEKCARPAPQEDDKKTRKILGNGLGLLQYIDTVSYLCDDILTKVDRASMSCSLELRAPLLDHRVYALAWRVPERWRAFGGCGKHMLKKVLGRYVPTELFDRPKMGFGIPLHQWIMGPLREWSEDMLSQKRLVRDGIFNPERIGEIWKRHKSGASDWRHHLWIILSFNSWLDRSAISKKDWTPLPVVWA